MRCSSCHYENPQATRFCGNCGAPLNNRCAKCGRENPPQFKFCGECGTPLQADSPAPAQTAGGAAASTASHFSEQPSVPTHDIPGDERKTVTAMFADIKGSTELMEGLDPEEARAIIDPALNLMIDAVHRYDGYIVQSTGDGIFALFGAPVAHEDHPQRAVYAALRVQDALKNYSAKLIAEGGTPLEARVGINTGEVVVRTLTTAQGQTEYTPIGHTTNLASRMQAVAATGSIAITEHTRRLVEGYFQLKSRGPTRMKGLSEPVNIYEVTGLGPLRTRLQRAVGRGLSKFVGRQAEMETLKRTLDQAKAGHGQIVAAMGEPGVGKSRLFFEFKAISQSGCLVLEAYSVSHGKASAYLPVIDLLQSYFEIAPEDDDRKRREKINGKVLTLDRSLEDTLPYLLGLLALVEGDDPFAQFDPQLRRRRTLEAIKRVLMRESLGQPLIVIFEDLHWIDSETQALLNLLVEGIATARIVLLVNYRPEYHHQWGSKTYYTQLRLDPLGRDNADQMLAALLTSPAPAALSVGSSRERSPVLSEAEDGRVRGRGGIAALKRLIIERTEGNPFFMEEMVQALFEQGVLTRNGAVKLAKPLDQIRVPPTVQAILASRIDRLPPAEKELLQTLAVLGREFPLSLIEHVAAGSHHELERMLSDLQAGEFIYEQPAIHDVEYIFKHPLTQEVAYNSVLSERRRMLHESAAASIEALFAGRIEDHITELARHYERSRNLPKAVEYLERAGQRAAGQSAHAGAIGYFTRALELLKQMPQGVDRDRGEMNLQLALGWSLYVAQGPQAFKREPVLVRARELSEQLGDTAKLMDVLLALALLRINQRDHGSARELAERVLVLAEPVKAPATIAGAHSLLGVDLFMVGEFKTAREHFERGLELFGSELPRGPLGHSTMIQAQAIGLRAACGSLLTHVLVFLGYPATGLKKARELLASARSLSDPYLIAYALFGEAAIATHAGDSQSAIAQSEELLSLATEHGFGQFHARALSFRGSALAGLGRVEEGISEMRRAISVSGAGGDEPMFGLLAEAYGKNRHPEEGLKAVNQGLTRRQQTGFTNFESDLYRIKGDLLLIRDAADELQAEQCFRTAIDVARGQDAKWWELRATISLARLLVRQNKREEARAMLAEIYGWFTEGFEFADLKDAKALLKELGASTP